MIHGMLMMHQLHADNLDILLKVRGIVYMRQTQLSCMTLIIISTLSSVCPQCTCGYSPNYIPVFYIIDALPANLWPTFGTVHSRDVQVHCTGNETSLDDCFESGVTSFLPVGEVTCNSHAGVVCEGM